MATIPFFQAGTQWSTLCPAFPNQPFARKMMKTDENGHVSLEFVQ
jgi:hypothetical protein